MCRFFVPQKETIFYDSKLLNFMEKTTYSNLRMIFNFDTLYLGKSFNKIFI